MTIETLPFDPTEVLDTPEAIEEFLIAAEEEGDPDYLAHAQEVAARARERWNLPNG